MNLNLPLYGIICNWKGVKEENYLYTADELKKRDPELYNLCCTSNEWHESTKSVVTNKTWSGKQLNNKRELFCFIAGGMNDTERKEENEDWYWKNSCDDLYDRTDLVHVPVSSTMADALKWYLKGFEQYKMLTISTGHITSETNELMLKGTAFSGVTYYQKGEYGYFIPVCMDVIEDCRDVPSDIKELLYFAHDNGFDWLCLDCDGPDMSDYGLQMYNW